MTSGGGFGRVRRLLDDGDDDGEPGTAVVVLAAAVAAAVLSPLVWLLVGASSLDVDAAVSLLTSGTATTVLVNSLALTAVVTVASVALGVPLAVLTVQTDLPFRRLWTVLSALPLVVPSYTGAISNGSR